MRPILLAIFSLLLISGCETTSSSSNEPELRIAFVNYSLGLTHNSHLNRGFPTPESAFSATITFEVFLTEETDHTNIYEFAIKDNEDNGWVFDSVQVRNAYSPNNNSLIFTDLQLRVFDFLNGKVVSAQFLDPTGEVIRERAFNLDNDFPLPARTQIDRESDNGYILTVDFYNTPYDGGNLPFDVTIYNTYYSSYFSIVWLDANNAYIREDFIDRETMEEVSDGTWTLKLNSDSVPSNAVYLYTTFRRGAFTRGGVLYTQLLSIPEFN